VKNSQGQAVIKFIKESKYPDGVSKYKFTKSNDIDDALKKLKNRTVDAVAVLPSDFTKTLNDAKMNHSYTSTKLKLYGDPRNSRYSIAAILLLTDFDIYVKAVTQTKVPVDIDETLIGKGKALTEFDFYVPGIILFAMLNVMFTAGASLIKEIEKGTMQRLVMSKLKTAEFLGAIGVVQVILCIVSLMLALLAALACGFEFKGSILAVALVGILSGIGVLGLAMITVSFMKSVYDLMTIGVIPYFFVMFFAGILFPLPQIQIASIGENIIKLNDFLPLSLSTAALNKILSFGLGIGDISFELLGMFIISMLYFVIGIVLFKRRHMRLL
jgi:ABC-2 type transport system permease protein